ncbi:cell growth regulator with RING finger domain protein 1 isoform X2 [Ornithorhynchus anatinus]|uniref:cell growth regulator with RING finger domain protein 1 isoform X2 n=1 Tax=Ornithorhynchus anatinus TaxID=9258 RepID=UPI0010A7E621|nr:cell growth regulator with RING finger domain protein 1 isoform X2 [Ornithorhynchus anatinus]
MDRLASRGAKRIGGRGMDRLASRGPTARGQRDGPVGLSGSNGSEAGGWTGWPLGEQNGSEAGGWTGWPLGVQRVGGRGMDRLASRGPTGRRQGDGPVGLSGSNGSEAGGWTGWPLGVQRVGGRGMDRLASRGPTGRRPGDGPAGLSGSFKGRRGVSSGGAGFLRVLLFRFGWDVPVILRNSEETESSARVSKKLMRQVKNPFSLEIARPSSASLSTGVSLTVDCLTDCVLTCYWGCSVQRLHEALRRHVHCARIKTPRALEAALGSGFLHRERHLVEKAKREEKLCRLSPDAGISDFGAVPRSRYPLVALLTLADEDDRDVYDIISMVSVVHVPDGSYGLSCRMLYQYLLLAQGQFHDLKMREPRPRDVK